MREFAAPPGKRSRGLRPWVGRLGRRLRSPRRVRPTLGGWIFLAIVAALFFAALNSGNNLLYLLLSLLFATIAVSGVLSEWGFRPLRVALELPAVVTAGEPFAFLARFENPSRWRAAYLLTAEPGALLRGAPLRQPQRRWLAYLPPAGKQGPAVGSLWQQATARRRGLYSIAEAYLTTRAPFGLFERKKRFPVDARLCVLPTPLALPLPELRGPALEGTHPLERAGEGFDLRTLRAYQSGESARKIAWRASARAGELLVRETESESLRRVQVRLEPAAGKMAPAYLDRQAGIARFICEELVSRRYRVALAVPGAPAPERYASTASELASELLPLAAWQGGAGQAPPPEPSAAVPRVRVSPTGRVDWPVGL